MSLCMSYFVAPSCANQFAGVDGSALSIVAALLFFSFRACVISQISLSRCFVGRCASDPVRVSSGVPSLGPRNQPIAR